MKSLVASHFLSRKAAEAINRYPHLVVLLYTVMYNYELKLH